MSKLEYPRADLPGTSTSITCPACHGVLREIKNVALAQFRCRVGHAYTPEALTEGLEEGVKQALWIALRTLEENAEVIRGLLEKIAEMRVENTEEAS